ncbi:hypothetical protein RBSWK_01869 [Rhodopirellula baltica SWK14]|uniref:Uncharacterized protein n=1 Tax=Rhodopirellula baltica SWK14 TaxID=993516 RepID=L7CKN1_RHOBT|nr:hypothetical protein RBSWK_01869 [Rhodopirellula baltica SWK14]
MEPGLRRCPLKAVTHRSRIRQEFGRVPTETSEFSRIQPRTN